jgi:DNA-binding FrmR family transcriptional regulator
MGKNEEFMQVLQADIKGDILTRLRRIEGQTRGIQRMIEEGRSCREVLLQLAAVKSAVVQTAMTILSNEMAGCVRKEIERGTNVDETMAEFMEVFKKFS